MRPTAVPISPDQLMPVHFVLCEVTCPVQAWPVPANEAHEMHFAMTQYGQKDCIMSPQALPWSMANPRADDMPQVQYPMAEYSQADCILPSQAQPWIGPTMQAEEVQFVVTEYDTSDGTTPPQPQSWIGPNLQAGETSEANSKTQLRRRQRRQRPHRRVPPVLKLPMPAGTAPCRPAALGIGAQGQSCGKITEGLEAGGQARVDALAQLCGSVMCLALAPEGCRAVQAALEVAPLAIATTLLAELRCHVREAVESPHANYVIQKIVEVMPGRCCDFVVEELCGIGCAVARHRYGCRVLCRLLEHGATIAGLGGLVEELLGEAAELCRHPFAHHVMQSVLEHGTDEQRSRVSAVLRCDLLANAQHRCASHLVEAALLYCPAEEVSSLAAELLCGGPEGVLSLAQGQFGSFVVRSLLRLQGASSSAARGYILQAAERLWADKYGQRVMADLVETPTSA